MGEYDNDTPQVRVSVFRKDTVTTADAEATFQFDAAYAGYLTLAYAVLRADSGILDVATTTTKTVDNQWGTATVDFTSVTSALDGSMVLLSAGTFAYEPGTPQGPTLSNASGATQVVPSSTVSRLALAYWPRDNGEGTGTAGFTWAFASGYGPNCTASVAMLLTDGGLEEIVVDGIELFAAAGEGASYLQTMTDGVLAHDAPARSSDDALADGARLEALVARLGRPAASAAAAVTVTPAAVATPKWARAVLERVVLARVLAPTAVSPRTVGDTVRMTRVVRTALSLVTGQALTVAQTVQCVRAIAVVEGLTLAQTPQALATYLSTFAEIVALSDGVANFFGADALDGITAADAPTRVLRARPVTSDGLTLADVLGRSIVLRVTCAEQVAMSTEELLRALFSPTLRDGIEVVAGYVAPDGAFTSWAVNTRTSAATEYTNFEFNSFTRMGRRYLAARDDGLYVLDGDDDAGSSIIADIKTGAMQFAGSRFSGVKAVYLGLRGDGEFRLKIIDGEGTERVYKIIAQSARTAKVQVGKGIRTRYLSFELTSTGQDFDLDAMEVMPLLAQRRV
jgi:hypothetical protein